MLILSIRTDKPEAEIGLYDDGQQIGHHVWQAHRRLAETINTKIKSLLQSKNKTINDLGGIAVFRGPGSFTGLRIGISVTNALADSLSIPTVGTSGDDWEAEGVAKLAEGGNDKTVLPEYGMPPHITKPKH